MLCTVTDSFPSQFTSADYSIKRHPNKQLGGEAPAVHEQRKHLQSELYVCGRVRVSLKRDFIMTDAGL